MRNNIKIVLITVCAIVLIIIPSLLDNQRNVKYPIDKKHNNLSTSNSVEVDWYHVWGGSEDDWTYDVAVDSSDQIYLAGDTDSFGAGFADMVLVKYDNYGVLQWYETWGGSDDDHCSAVVVDSSDNVYIAGETYSFGAGKYDMILVKYDSSGVQQWNRTWGTSNNNEGGGDMSVDSSDNVYIVGYTYSSGDWNITLVKYDSFGVLKWNRSWDCWDQDYGYGVAIDSSDSIYITGYTRYNSTSPTDLVLLKYDSSGALQLNITWERSIHDRGYDIAIDSSDNIYIVGQTVAPNSDLLLVKYDTSGVRWWYCVWGGSDDETGWGLAVDSSDNIYVGGDTSSFGEGSIDMALVCYNSSGILQWNRTWGGAYWDSCAGIILDSSNNVYLAGSYRISASADVDMVLIKYGKEKAKENQIPGYSLLIFLAAISMITAVYLKKKLTK